MTDKIQQARRDAFEAAYLKNYLYPAERWSLVPEKYRTQHAEIAWWAFNAALDCVVIELPAELHAYTGQPQEDRLLDADRNHTIKQCRAAIESTSLGIKIE